MKPVCILIIGLPGAGKTALAQALAERINAIHWNADEIRATISRDLGFSSQDRIEQAKRIGWLSRSIKLQGHNVIADFICPTEATREAFYEGLGNRPQIIVWVDRIEKSRYEDTDALWERPEDYDIRFTYGSTIEEQVNAILHFFNLPDWKAPTTLMLGRYQPWHDGHSALYSEANKRTNQVLIGVRDTYKTGPKDPLPYSEVLNYISIKETNRPFSLKLPNITNIVYGRDVGYEIEQIDLGKEIHAISATEKRKKMGL